MFGLLGLSYLGMKRIPRRTVMGRIFRLIAVLVNAFASLAYSTVEDPLILTGTPQNQELLEAVVKKSPKLNDLTFEPSALLLSGYFSTLLNAAFTANHKWIHSKLQYRREIISLSDGGRVAIDYGAENDEKLEDGSQRPLIVIFPGGLSTIEDHYHRTFIDLAVAKGYDWALIN